MIDSEIELLRDRDDQTEAAAGHAEGSYGSVKILARTKTVGTYPTVAQSFYAMESVAVLGEEVEGGAVVIEGQGDTFHAGNVGTAIPPSGTVVEVTFWPHRWTFQHD